MVVRTVLLVIFTSLLRPQVVYERAERRVGGSPARCLRIRLPALFRCIDHHNVRISIVDRLKAGSVHGLK